MSSEITLSNETKHIVETYYYKVEISHSELSDRKSANISIVFINNEFSYVDFRAAVDTVKVKNIGEVYTRKQWKLLKKIEEKITELEARYEERERSGK